MSETKTTDISAGYLTGTAGSLVMSCRTCGRDSFRDPALALADGYVETCLGCGAVKEPVRTAEIDTVWVPIWDEAAARYRRAWEL